MKSAIFLAEGFEECEALITADMLKRGGQEVDLVSISADLNVKGSHGFVIQADVLYKDMNAMDYDALILPGGKLGTANLEAFEPLKTDLEMHYGAGKLTCAICAAPSVLGHMGLLKDRHYTCFPTFDEDSFGGTYEMELSVTDGNVITGRGMGATIEFARNILKQCISEEELKQVEYGIQYEHSFKE